VPGPKLSYFLLDLHQSLAHQDLGTFLRKKSLIPRKATNCGFSPAVNTTIAALLMLAIARYCAPLCLALDAHCSPEKTQFATFRGINKKHKKLSIKFHLYNILFLKMLL